MGDFILTFPVLAALRRRFPAAHIELLANAHYASLATATGLADDYSPLDSADWAPAFAPHAELTHTQAQWLAPFDLILSYLHDPEKTFETNLHRATNAQWISCPHRPETSPSLPNPHAADFLLQSLAHLGIHPPAELPSLKLPDADSLTPTLALHPGSGSSDKNWPESHWGTLLDHLATETDVPLLLLGGEAEYETLPRLANRIPAHRRHVLFNKPLPDVARALAGCTAFLGHDSGPTHLAAALGLSTFALWGSTPLETWRPLGPSVQILHPPEDLATLSPQAVLQALASHLNPVSQP